MHIIWIIILERAAHLLVASRGKYGVIAEALLCSLRIWGWNLLIMVRNKWMDSFRKFYLILINLLNLNFSNYKNL